MADPTIYAVKNKRDHIDRLYEIANLAKIGAAATNTVLNLDHLDSAQCTLWEVIYTLASEGIEIAEMEKKGT
ncbi:hypothetical protein VK792_07810 [Mesobacterium sp. TK19101]|uniref:Uncharacterized protein n=1 Tax=Mesobacterium hydrothermale TaxID=3111907 RepID=A0ABU6HJ85_9RHOB|nr:hypothetical protein [Mesobacterium sp. TK19101]MEC3861185.1 hypothetical protein [Mesobacterium sp. TK19101]